MEIRTQVKDILDSFKLSPPFRGSLTKLWEKYLGLFKDSRLKVYAINLWLLSRMYDDKKGSG